MGPNYAQRADDELHRQLDESLPTVLRLLYTLLVLVKGTDTTLQDVHDAWAVWRMRSTPDHPSLIPFDELDPEVQELDRPYMDAIHRTAVALGVCRHVWDWQPGDTLACLRCGLTPVVEVSDAG